VTSQKLKAEIRGFVNGTLADYERLVERHGADRVMLLVRDGEPEIWVTLSLSKELLGTHDKQRVRNLRIQYLSEERCNTKIIAHFYRYEDIALIPPKSERRWRGGGGAKARMKDN
jgi:hypothetical protein